MKAASLSLLALVGLTADEITVIVVAIGCARAAANDSEEEFVIAAATEGHNLSGIMTAPTSVGLSGDGD
jgi:hypothetical protein